MSTLTVYWDKDFKVKTLTPVTQSANGKSASIGLNANSTSGDSQAMRLPTNTKSIVIAHAAQSNQIMHLALEVSNTATTLENQVAWQTGSFHFALERGKQVELPTEGLTWFRLTNLTSNGATDTRFSILYLTA